MMVTMCGKILGGVLVAFMLHQCRGFLVDNTPDVQNATCLDSKDVCDFLNMTYNICNNTQLAREHCQLFCNLCDAVDGRWSVWVQWSGCDVTCGNGTRSRVRSCDNPAPAHGGVDCVGSNNEQQICVVETCPVHGGWSGWTAWGSCSTSCGVGLQRRDRSCDNPWPSKDGNHCNGDNINYRVCADALCTDGWDSWSTWSSCSVTCGPGLKHRHRTCNDTMGKALGGGCIGTDQEYAECNITLCDTIVLFYAHGPRDLDISINEKIVYGTITTNKGGGYNSSDGVFIAPQEGLYLFTSQTCGHRNSFACTGITKDGVILQTSNIIDADFNTCSSMQSAVQLRVGERVWVQGTSTSALYESSVMRCSFSGMLIK